MPAPRSCSVDELDVVTIAEAPRLCALYRRDDPEYDEPGRAGDGSADEVAGWVLAWPNGVAVTVLTEGDRPQFIAGSLSSVAGRWAAIFGAELVAVAHPQDQPGAQPSPTARGGFIDDTALDAAAAQPTSRACQAVAAGSVSEAT